MDQLWLIVAVIVGILIVGTAAFLKRNRRNVFRDSAFLSFGIALVVLGILFGDDQLVGTRLSESEYYWSSSFFLWE